MSLALTAATVLSCPHGAPGVLQVPGSRTAGVNGVQMATMVDPVAIAGCPFMLPPSVPSPCVSVQWVSGSTITTVDGNPALNDQSVGLCLSAAKAPQGTVLVVSTQSAVEVP